MMSSMMQPQIVLLREGTDDSQGVGQLISNINAAEAIAGAVRTSLGPRGMDKLLTDSKGKVTISNDGATIMKLLEIVHPAASSLVDIAKSQDAEVGDGTTSVVVVAGELLTAAKPFVEEGVHPRVIISAYRKAANAALAHLSKLAVPVDASDPTKSREMLERCAATALSSKLVNTQRNFFGKMVVDAVQVLDADLALDMVGIKKVTGGAMEDSVLIKGVAFKKTFSYAGFEQQPKRIVKPRIALLNHELELKAERENAEIRVDDAAAYQAVVDAEWNIIYEKLDALADSGATVVLSKLPIGDLATQYFADKSIFCAGRVSDADMARVARATGAKLQTSLAGFNSEVLGECGLFEERQVGGERFNFFTDCPATKTATIVLRGGAEQFIDEAERSLHDAIMIVRRAIKSSTVVAGGGAIEMELSKHLRELARSIAGKDQLIVNAFARALEVIPRQIADNAGFDSIDILNKLRHKHAATDGSGKWWGVDMDTEDITDTFASHVWEPSVVKRNVLTAATEAAALILSIDETVKNPKSEQADPNNFAGLQRGRGRGRGRGR